MQIKLPYVFIALVLGTFAFGLYGWMLALSACPRPETATAIVGLPAYCDLGASDSELWPDALYLTLLAFSLEAIYSPPANLAVEGMSRGRLVA
jgi:hypothetical protein